MTNTSLCRHRQIRKRKTERPFLVFTPCLVFGHVGYLCRHDSAAVSVRAQASVLDGVVDSFVEHQHCADEESQGGVDYSEHDPDHLRHRIQYCT